MNIYPVEFNPIYINDTQDMEAVEFEDIPKDTKFDMWDEVDNYFDEYGARNGFAIIKYRMDRNSKGQVYKRTLVYEFADKINNDAFVLLTKLMQKKAEDLCWIVDFELDKDNRLTRLLWMSPDQVEPTILVSDESLDTHIWILNCIKRATNQAPIVMFTDADPSLNAVIPIMTNGIVLLNNSINVITVYVNHYLNPNCRSWARAYLHKIFTVGIKSTARVEGYNWIIKQQLKANSTLCEIVN
ncbi:hypothetical protein RhiirC2_795049 [Rhizophagus irregularis]|uniref:MULE transposase domain-containing protein n=1 Tax=Rhizophagus irregularis TaxID=588596 RepID=A0A2N1MCE8_9GLOM|nr:hypothetical protein RhiirC2_795049 [Rhizophagus irregularis]